MRPSPSRTWCAPTSSSTPRSARSPRRRPTQTAHKEMRCITAVYLAVCLSVCLSALCPQDMKSNTYERMSLQDHRGLPRQEWRRIRAELRDISVESYPEDVKAVINMPDVEEMQPESVVGRLCRLEADGTYMPAFLMLLRAHGLLRVDRSK